jgi:hypothetical protein
MTIITVLNSFEEEEALRRLKKDARSLCDKKISGMHYCRVTRVYIFSCTRFNPKHFKLMLDFVECTKTGTFSIAWNCSKLNESMNACLKSHSSDEQLDAYREKVLFEKTQRLKELGILGQNTQHLK